MERSPLSLDVNRRPKGANNEIKRRGISQHTAAKVVREYVRRVYDDVGNVVETHEHTGLLPQFPLFGEGV
jgi:hypothetical protein